MVSDGKLRRECSHQHCMLKSQMLCCTLKVVSGALASREYPEMWTVADLLGGSMPSFVTQVWAWRYNLNLKWMLYPGLPFLARMLPCSAALLSHLSAQICEWHHQTQLQREKLDLPLSTSTTPPSFSHLSQWSVSLSVWAVWHLSVGPFLLSCLPLHVRARWES